MSAKQASYRQIMKATSIFGGVQVFNIIIGIIRSKLVAVLLGPAGMGIFSLLQTTLRFISGITNFGLGTSAVRDIAAASNNADPHRIASIVKIFRRLIWITGLLGTVITFVLAPWLSQIAFGNKDYTIAFMLISVTFILGQLGSGQNVLLQGMRKVQYLAKANVLGSILGLVISIPLYYSFGTKGIVPTIILTAAASVSVSFYFSSKIKIADVYVSKIRTLAEGKRMLSMGVLISLGGMIGLASSYLLSLFIRKGGGVAEVGLYNAGFGILNSYIGLVFGAMATDFYPRLSAVAHSNQLSKKTINEQAEIMVLILAPILIAFLVFVKFLVILLYSNKFIAVDVMIHWAALGVFFQAASWCVGFVLLAKGAGKFYFWSELTGHCYQLLLNIVGYHFWGLDGLGISFLTSYVLYLIQIFFIAKIKYEFSFERKLYIIFAVQFLLATCCFVLVRNLPVIWSYSFGSIIIIISLVYSYSELDKRLDVKQIVTDLKAKIIK